MDKTLTSLVSQNALLNVMLKTLEMQHALQIQCLELLWIVDVANVDPAT